MFWKKKTETVAASGAAAAPVAEASEAKTAEQPETTAQTLPPEQTLESQIMQLTPGQAIAYQHPAIYGGGLSIVELNPNYPDKGKRYSLNTEELADGKPTGKTRQLWESDKVKDIAHWVLERDGKPFSG